MNDDPRETPELDERTRRDLVQLADGTLSGSRRPALEARVANSAELAAALRRQLVAATALRSLTLGAPLGLRERLAREQPDPSAAPWRFAFAGGLVTACAAVLFLFFVLPAGSGPSLREATRVAALPATQPVAAGDSSDPNLLPISGDGVAFPNLEGEFGWRAVGSRSDELEGRDATTVYYERDGRRVAYTILAGEAIEAPSDSRTTSIDDVAFSGFEEGGMRAVTWQREGRTCVLSGRGVGEAELVELASWQGKGSVDF